MRYLQLLIIKQMTLTIEWHAIDSVRVSVLMLLRTSNNKTLPNKKWTKVTQLANCITAALKPSILILIAFN